MKFEQKLRFRRNCLIGLVIIGFMAIAVGFVKMQAADKFEYISYCFSTGISMVIAGSIKLRQTVVALSNRKKLENLHIEEDDEWNMMVRYKATYYAFVATIITSYSASLVFLFVDSGMFIPFIIANSILVAFYLFFTLILRVSNRDLQGAKDEQDSIPGG